MSKQKTMPCIPEQLVSQVLNRDERMCKMCGQTGGERDPYDGMPIRLSVDFFTPIECGGMMVSTNLRTICSTCKSGLDGIPYRDRPSTKRKKRNALSTVREIQKKESDTNLRSICSVFNEGASNLTLERPSGAKLLAQVRRATGGDQVALLEWLIKKFPKQTSEILERRG